jgi:bifunctional pyridoxal-dependent enzyme with beta-cystathionase and maltose regulon repressor activities
VINADLITPQQTEYVMMILQLVMECQRPVPDKLIKFPLFGVIAALSERIVALDDVVTKCLNKMDFSALKAKLVKARDMFIVCDPHGTVCLVIAVDQLTHSGHDILGRLAHRAQSWPHQSRARR